MKARPNDPCPCGSGVKYKRCHGVQRGGRVGGRDSFHGVGELIALAARLEATGRLVEAEAAIQRVLNIVPDSAEAWLALGRLAERGGDIETARDSYRQLVTLHPAHAAGWFLLGNTQARLHLFAQARESYRRVIEIAPELPGVWGNLGNVEKYLGNFPLATACYRKDVDASDLPAERVRRHSNLVFALHYDEDLSHEALFDAHREWADLYAKHLYPTQPVVPESLADDRLLRLAYLSGSLNGQIVGHFLHNVLSSHDRQQFRVTLYSSTKTLDERSGTLRGLCDEWVDIGGIDDEAAAARIRADRIDILVDLDGHSPTGRPLILARKPAPIQVEWLDYFDTTGLDTVDYILTDPYTTPEDSPQRFTETPVRLPDTRFCYTPPAYAPEPAPMPTLAGAPFTFGSFNRQDKLHPRLLQLWADILRGAPHSRLLLKNRALQVPAVRQALRETFSRHGIAAERLLLRGPSPHAEMLAEYAEVDIGLDTFPYNGGLTSCECLWMGVPIVALEAERMISRQTSALLRMLGLEDWVAASPEEYVRLAVEKASNPGALAAVRGVLRARMAASTLCDAARFTRNLESAYRGMWQRYCAAQGQRGSGGT